MRVFNAIRKFIFNLIVKTYLFLATLAHHRKLLRAMDDENENLREALEAHDLFEWVVGVRDVLLGLDRDLDLTEEDEQTVIMSQITLEELSDKLTSLLGYEYARKFVYNDKLTDNHKFCGFNVRITPFLDFKCIVATDEESKHLVFKEIENHAISRRLDSKLIEEISACSEKND